MGNLHSRRSPSPGDTRKHPYKRQRSTIFSRISLGCVPADVEAHDDQRDSQDSCHLAINEKSPQLVDIAPVMQPQYHWPQPTPLPPVPERVPEPVYAPMLINIESECDSAYQEFLYSYPGPWSGANDTACSS